MKQIRHHFAVRPVDTEAVCLWGFGVQERMPPCMIHRPSGIEVYLLAYFYDEVYIHQGEDACLCPSGSLVLWEPGVPHQFGHPTSPWNHTWLLCAGTLLEKQVVQQRLPCNQVVHLADPSVLERCFLDIEAEVSRHAHPHGEIVRNALHTCFIELGRFLHPQDDEAVAPEEFLAVMHYMEEHFTSPLTLSELAARMHRSVPRFCSAFHHYFGFPPIEYLIRLRLHKATYLLHDRNLSITEIAQQLGYADLYYFSRQFRKHYGISPQQMRTRFFR